VSANPTGPLNVVSARAAAVGATLVRLLEATGHEAAGEFYVNDAGSQVDLLGESVAARFAERAGVPRPFPKDGYLGAYVGDIAATLPVAEARAALDRGDSGWFRDQALERMVAGQRRDLLDYGTEFSGWLRESSLHRSGAVGETLAALEARGMIYRARQPESWSGDRPPGRDEEGEGREEATYLRTHQFGDDIDRVVVRSTGVPTYLLPDIAYHRDKHARGFRHAIDLWGPDHHGYIPRMKAALQALGLEPDFLEVLIVQQVNLLSKGAPVKMSKRAGEFVTLRDLCEDVGADCAKFFFLMRSTSAHLDFDLDLARTRNDENPAYYVQYAHARIASIVRYAAERDLKADTGRIALEQPEETALVRKLAAFPEVVRGAAVAREPHRLPTYLGETAAEFHRFYHACRVVGDDPARSRQRLLLSESARIVIRNGLALMGVSAPERMERASEVTSGGAPVICWSWDRWRSTPCARPTARRARCWAARRRTLRSRPPTSRRCGSWRSWARISRAATAASSRSATSISPVSRPPRDAPSAGAASTPPSSGTPTRSRPSSTYSRPSIRSSTRITAMRPTSSSPTSTPTFSSRCWPR